MQCTIYQAIWCLQCQLECLLQRTVSPGGGRMTPPGPPQMGWATPPPSTPPCDAQLKDNRAVCEKSLGFRVVISIMQEGNAIGLSSYAKQVHWSQTMSPRMKFTLSNCKNEMGVKQNYIEEQNSLRQTGIYLIDAKSHVLEYSTRARQIVLYIIMVVEVQC